MAELLPGIHRIETNFNDRRIAMHLLVGEKALLVDSGFPWTATEAILPYLEQANLPAGRARLAGRHPRLRRSPRRQLGHPGALSGRLHHRPRTRCTVHHRWRDVRAGARRRIGGIWIRSRRGIPRLAGIPRVARRTSRRRLARSWRRADRVRPPAAGPRWCMPPATHRGT